MHILPTPLRTKQLHTVIEPSPSLTVGTLQCGSYSYFGVCNTITFSSEPKRLDFDPSNHITVSQNPIGFFNIFLANCSRLPRFTLLTDGFFSATRPNNPASCARFLIVLACNEIPNSASLSVLIV